MERFRLPEVIDAIGIVRMPILQPRSDYVVECVLQASASIPSGQDIVGGVVKVCLGRTVDLGLIRAHRINNRSTRDVKERRAGPVERSHVDLGESAAAGGIEKKTPPSKTDLCSRVAAPILFCMAFGRVGGISCSGCCGGECGGVSASEAKNRM